MDTWLHKPPHYSCLVLLQLIINFSGVSFCCNSYLLSPLNTLYLLYKKYGVLAMSLSVHTVVAVLLLLGTTCEFSNTALPNIQSMH